MKVTIKGNTLVIEAPINDNPPLSKSEKTLLIATTSGFAKAGIDHKGGPVSVSLNATIPNPDYKKKG